MPYDEPVTLTTRFHGDVDVAEVRFTAFYPDWPNAKNAAKLPGFDPKADMAHAQGLPTQDEGLHLGGRRAGGHGELHLGPDRRREEALDPGRTQGRPSHQPWFEEVRARDPRHRRRGRLGHHHLGPGGKIAQRCDAKAKGLARTVYLDPLAPPAAPGNVVDKILSTRNPAGDAFFSKVRVTWDDVPEKRATASTGATSSMMSIQRPRRTGCYSLDAGRPELLGTVPANTTVFRYELFRGYGDVPWLTGGEYLVTAFNKAGETTGSSKRSVDPTVPDGVYGAPRCR